MQFSLHIYDHSYRIGDSWNRFHLHESEFRSLPNQIQKFQYAIATQKQVDRPATSSITYLGEFAGLHLVATNRHVLSLLDGPRCSRERIFHFTTLGIETYCDSLLIEGDGIDYAILSISSDQENLSILKENSPILGLNSGHSIRTPLVLAGHGRYRNIYSELTFNISDDCQIFDEELRYFSNIGDVGMITCNASPGDSGGPVILRESGALIGIIRGGRYGASINSSSSLHEVLDLSIDEKLEYRHTHYLPLAVIKVDVESRLDQVEDLTHRQALRELFKLD